MIQETLSNGDYKTYAYDGRNRLTTVRYFKADGTGTLVTKYTYSSSDELLSMEDLRVEGGRETRYRYTQYTYDDMGQMTGYAEYDGEKKEPGNQLSYAYDPDGNLLSVGYSKPENHVVSLKYAYDEYGRPASIAAGMDSGAEHTLRTYVYTPDGKVQTIYDYRNFMSGSTEDYIRRDYSYDILGRLIQAEYYDSSQPEAAKESYSYTYDKNSNILMETLQNDNPKEDGDRVDEVRTHSYNRLGQLVSTEILDRKTDTVRAVAYTYDKVGNRLTETKDGATTSCTYNSLNQLVSAIKTNGSLQQSAVQYSYDANGSLTEENDSVAESRKLYRYDEDNRLVFMQIQQSGTTLLTQENLYNGRGQRILKKENGTETGYYYQNDVVVAAADGKGSRRSFNLLGLEGNVIASGRYAGSHAGEYGIYSKDGRGSTTGILLADGSCAASYEYTDFGETIIHGDRTFENEICYTGGVYDAGMGLYYLNARYYTLIDEVR